MLISVAELMIWLTNSHIFSVIECVNCTAISVLTITHILFDLLIILQLNFVLECILPCFSVSLFDFLLQVLLEEARIEAVELIIPS